MAKYYVTCGPITDVFSADSAEQAAILAMDAFFAADRWIYDDDGLSDRMRRDYLALEVLMQLAPEMIVSQRGFQRDEAGYFGTPEILDQWHELMTGMSCLLAVLGAPPSGLSEQGYREVSPPTPRSHPK